MTPPTAEPNAIHDPPARANGAEVRFPSPFVAKVSRYFPTRSIMRWIIAGVLSTAIMDAGSTLVRLTGFTAGLTPALIGRWFALLVRGEAPVSDIAAASPVAGEVPIALLGHYAIGTGLTFLFAASISLCRVKPASRTGFLFALGMGLVTSFLAWLWMFPSMGYGLFGHSAPPELMLLRSSLVNHAFFGLGLAVTSRWAGARR